MANFGGYISILRHGPEEVLSSFQVLLQMLDSRGPGLF